jgi:hypothetical protein
MRKAMIVFKNATTVQQFPVPVSRKLLAVPLFSWALQDISSPAAIPSSFCFNHVFNPPAHSNVSRLLLILRNSLL